MPHLISYITVSDLLQGLVTLGYQKAPTTEPRPHRPQPGEGELITAGGVAVAEGDLRYDPFELQVPCWRSSDATSLARWGVRHIDIYPSIGWESGDVYLQVLHDADGLLDHSRWQMVESFAGDALAVDPKQVTLDNIDGLLRTWVHSWQTQ